MNDSQINWYSMNTELAVEDRGPVDLNEALKIVDRYAARDHEKFEDAEKAIAATMFGFSRSKSDFIEIGVMGPNRFSYKFEMADPEAPWFRKIFGGLFQHYEELPSRDELVRKVEEFFTTPVMEIKRRLKGR